jgi:hypothetical protein
MGGFGDTRFYGAMDLFRRCDSRAGDDYRVHRGHVLPPGCTREVDGFGNLVIAVAGGARMSASVDPVELAIFQSAVHSIAEEMGAALRRTALSPNIKERRDYSCAVFDGQGR